MAALPEGPHEEVELERIVLRGADGTDVPAIHARPLGLPSLGVVLHPDIMGIRPLFDEMCRRLATHGVAVICPEPFARVAEAERSSLDAAGRMAKVPTLEDELQLGDLEAAADRLVVDDDVTAVAVVGFCMGGMYALKAAATGRFDQAVSFYGMIRVPQHWRSATLREPLETAPEACPTLAILGGADQFTPPDDVEALREAWRDRPDCEVVLYPDAEHGFVHDDTRPAHRAGDAADAWGRALAFLGVR
jgi:carboxymethylenebutenolidase